MEANIKSIIKKVFDNIPSNLDKCKDALKDFQTNFLKSSRYELEQIPLMHHIVTKSIRLF